MSIKGLFQDFRDYITMKPEAEVRDFIGDFDWFLNQRNVEPKSIPGVRHVPELANHSNGAEKRLSESFIANHLQLHWGQSYGPSDFGQPFVDSYGFVEMMGTRGHFDANAMSGGFLLLGPNLHYPSHRHVAEELYIPLTGGAYWSRDGGLFVERKAGEIIQHESNEPHAIETPKTPLLALYLWRGGDLAQKPEF